MEVGARDEEREGNREREKLQENEKVLDYDTGGIATID